MLNVGEQAHVRPDTGAAGASTHRGLLSNVPLRVDVQLGDTIRIFGRSLGWSTDNKMCVSAADTPGPISTTRLFLVSDAGKPAGAPSVASTASQTQIT